MRIFTCFNQFLTYFNILLKISSKLVFDERYLCQYCFSFIWGRKPIMCRIKIGKVPMKNGLHCTFYIVRAISRQVKKMYHGNRIFFH